MLLIFVCTNGYKFKPNIFRLTYSFLKLKSRIILSKNAFIIIDPQWPKEYVVSFLNQVKPDYLIYEYVMSLLKKEIKISKHICNPKINPFRLALRQS